VPLAFVALQEVRNATVLSSLQDTITRIFPRFFSATHIAAQPSLHDLGLMTVSSVPIRKEVKVLLPRLHKHPLNPQLYVMRTIPNHGALITLYKIGNKILRITNVHFHVMGGIRHKRKQIRAILSIHAQQKADYDIICGDFNTIGIYPGMRRRITKQIDAVQMELGNGYHRINTDTWTSDVATVMSPLTPMHRITGKFARIANIHFRQQLDWIFYRNLNVKNSSVEHGLIGSDHYPLLAEFECV
jgi:endonuclease/exonuclease/phosphatase family metal-dependent hydrolase